MDEKYCVEYIQFNREKYIEACDEYDNLTDAIKAVSDICNSNTYRYEHVWLKWGDSLLLELYGD